MKGFARGIATSELWVTVAGMVIVLLNQITGDSLDFNELHTAIAGGIAAVYTIARTILKAFGRGGAPARR
jgi:hypothetical protein